MNGFLGKVVALIMGLGHINHRPSMDMFAKLVSLNEYNKKQTNYYFLWIWQ